jgi:hypothetical protein
MPAPRDLRVDRKEDVAGDAGEDVAEDEVGDEAEGAEVESPTVESPAVEESGGGVADRLKVDASDTEREL